MYGVCLSIHHQQLKSPCSGASWAESPRLLSPPQHQLTLTGGSRGIPRPAMRCISPSGTGSALRSPPSRLCQEHLPRKAPWWHLNTYLNNLNWLLSTLKSSSPTLSLSQSFSLYLWGRLNSTCRENPSHSLVSAISSFWWWHIFQDHRWGYSRSCLTTLVNSPGEIDIDTPFSSLVSAIEGGLAGFRSLPKCSILRPTTSPGEVSSVPSLLYTAWMVSVSQTISHSARFKCLHAWSQHRVTSMSVILLCSIKS